MAVDPDSALLVELDRVTQPIDGSTIHLQSPDAGDSTRFKGTAIDTAYYRFFTPFYYGPMSGHGDLFGLVRFVPAPGYRAYVLRVPGMYDPSRLALWVYDESGHYWLPPEDAAEYYGDAGATFRWDSWFVDLDHDGTREWMIRKQLLDDSEEGAPGGWDSLFVRNWGAQGFAKGYRYLENDTLSAHRRTFTFPRSQ